MGIENLGNIVNAVKNLNITDEQKAAIKNSVKTCGNNKEKIVEELKKHNVNVSASQIDTVLGMIDKL